MGRFRGIWGDPAVTLPSHGHIPCSLSRSSPSSHHFHKQLVEGLARVVVPVLAIAADGVDLVDKDDAGRLFLGSLHEEKGGGIQI